MDNEFIRDTIERIIRLIEEHYIFPETASTIRKELNRRLLNKEYESINEVSVFGEILTKQLQAISR